MVVKTASQLCLLEVGCNVLIWHLLEASLDEIRLLNLGLVIWSGTTKQHRLTSSSLQARPPPVDEALRFFEIP